MPAFSRDAFADAIRAYLSGRWDQDELYYWSCSFTGENLEDPLLDVAWVTMHQLHESNPDYKTTDEELDYIAACLEGLSQYDERELQSRRDLGMERRFKKIGGYN